MKRLRILCLHGYRGSARTLQDQMKPLVSDSESLVEYIAIDAPTLTSGDFGWWRAVADKSSAASGDPGVNPAPKHYKGWTRTRELLESVFAERGPFDGVFGFSQGAALTGLLVGLRASDGLITKDKPLSFGFAILVGGFTSNDPKHAALYSSSQSYSLPSLHLIGLADSIVPSEVSQRLAAKFTNPTLALHSGGHVIPSTPEIRQQYRAFLAAFAG